METLPITTTTKKNRKKKKIKRLLSIKEAVKVYGATEWFWRSQIWSGKLPVVVVGRKQWFDKRDLNRFIKANKTRHGVV